MLLKSKSACNDAGAADAYFHPRFGGRLVIGELDLFDEDEPFDCDVMPLDPEPPEPPGARVP